MEVRKKVVYEAPKADAVEIKPEGIVCDSTNYVMWFMGEGTPNSLSSQDTEWDRTGYGSAEDF